MHLETINDIDYMDGHDFEYLCADVLRKNGYSNVSVTSGSGDFGIDVLAEKDGVRYAIQCKRWNNKVTNKAVQEALSGKVYYGYDRAAVLTNNYFNEHAIETARRTGVILWDRDTLISWIKNAYPNTVSFPTQQKASWFSIPARQSGGASSRQTVISFPNTRCRRNSRKKKPKLLGTIVAIILLLAIIPKNNKQVSQKQNTGSGIPPTNTVLPTSTTTIETLSTKEKPTFSSAPISSFDGNWELQVADEDFHIQYNANWPIRIIDTKAGTITINWANKPTVYKYEILSNGKLAFSYYWEEYTTSFYEEIEIKDGMIVSTLWYKGSAIPCNYFVYEAST